MKKILVFGGAGLVGSRFIDLNSKVFEINSPDISKTDILNKDAVLKTIEEFNPDSVINFAAFTNVEAAEDQKEDQNGICFKINVLGAQNVAEAVKSFDKHLIHISTEYVFDGKKETFPYIEEDKPNPVNWYGQTKYYGEQHIQESGCNTALVRICMPFSHFYELRKDIARFFLGELKEGRQIKAILDQRITPTLVDDISEALKNIVLSRSKGLYHVSSTDSATPLEFAKNIAEVFNLDYSLISEIGFDPYNEKKKGKLLRYSWLNPTKFEREFGEGILHTVEEALILFKKQIDSSSRAVDSAGENRI